MQKFTFKLKGKSETVMADKFEKDWNGIYSYTYFYSFYRKKIGFEKIGFEKEQEYELVARFLGKDIENLKEEHDFPYKETTEDLKNDIRDLHEMILILNKKRKKKPFWSRRLF